MEPASETLRARVRLYERCALEYVRNAVRSVPKKMGSLDAEGSPKTAYFFESSGMGLDLAQISEVDVVNSLCDEASHKLDDW